MHHEAGFVAGMHIVPGHHARVIHALVEQGVIAHGFHEPMAGLRAPCAPPQYEQPFPLSVPHRQLPLVRQRAHDEWPHVLSQSASVEHW